MNTFSVQTTADFVKRYWPEQAVAPKHKKLTLAFQSSIMDGYWMPGARLPTEEELVSATPCSLGTVQHAMRNLVATGVIKRRRGSGTIVADINRPIAEPWHMRFFDNVANNTEPLPVFTTVIKRELLHQRGPWSIALKQQDKSVIRVDRIFIINSTVKIFSIFYACSERFPELLEGPISALDGKNIKILIAQKYRVPVHKIRQHIRTEIPATEITSVSDCLPGQYANVLNVVAYAVNGEAIYYQDFYLPPTPYMLDLGTSAND